jgi:hypothetical protein
MSTIFDFLNGILFTKKEIPSGTIEDEKNFDIFMINRWVSMVDKDCAKIINETTNRISSALPSKKAQYDFLSSVIPKQKFRKIHYIKRKSVD